jgi:cytochrome b
MVRRGKVVNTAQASSNSVKVRVWDLPTRVFHWALALCIVGLVITGNVGGNAMAWHFRIGLTVLALLLFRLVWGLVGGRWSRFAAFIYSPVSIINDLLGRGKPEHSVGHTPSGSVSVFALLAILLAQVASGLVSDDEISNAGPLTRFVSAATVNLATHYHSNIGKWIILALVVLHIGAIAFYLRRKQNLIKPMLDGDKDVAVAVLASRDDAASRMGALVIFGICGAFVVWVSRLAG